jgi:hypothetical protein
MDDTRALNRRYSLVGWGALFLWIGVVSIVPGERLPFGLGLLGVGVILFAINLARCVIHRIPVHWTNLTLGGIALVLGAAELFQTFMLIAAALIAIGLVLLTCGALAPKIDCCRAPR